MNPASPLIIALDDMSTEQIQALCEGLIAPVTLKVNDLLFQVGLKGISALRDQLTSAKYEWMLDPKFKDTGNTVGNYLQRLHDSDMRDATSLLTLHASGGTEMLKSAVKKRDLLQLKTRLLAITVLTTMTEEDCQLIHGGGINQIVLRFAKFARNFGIDGAVCAPKETEMLRHEMGDDFLIVNPNIRLPDQVVENDDQNPDRSRTPKEAFDLGADYIVVGRPITKAKHPPGVINLIGQDVRTSRLNTRG